MIDGDALPHDQPQLLRVVVTLKWLGVGAAVNFITRGQHSHVTHYQAAPGTAFYIGQGQRDVYKRQDKDRSQVVTRDE